MLKYRYNGKRAGKEICVDNIIKSNLLLMNNLSYTSIFDILGFVTLINIYKFSRTDFCAVKFQVFSYQVFISPPR